MAVFTSYDRNNGRLYVLLRPYSVILHFLPYVLATIISVKELKTRLTLLFSVLRLGSATFSRSFPLEGAQIPCLRMALHSSLSRNFDQTITLTVYDCLSLLHNLGSQITAARSGSSHAELRWPELEEPDR